MLIVNGLNSVNSYSVKRNRAMKSAHVPQGNMEIPQIQKDSDKQKKIALILTALLGIGTALYFILRKKAPEVTSDIATSSEKPISTQGETSIIPHWKEYTDLLRAESEAQRKMLAENDNEKKQPLVAFYRDCVSKRKAYEGLAKTEHFSLIENKDLSGLTEEEKIKYFTNDELLHKMRINEETTFTGLEMFEKYGLRAPIEVSEKGKVLNTTLSKLFLLSVPDKPTDKLVKKYIEVMNKYAVKNSQKDRNDIDTLTFMLSQKAQHSFYTNITEDTLLDAIKLYNKMLYENPDPTNDSIKFLQMDLRETYIAETKKFENSPKREIIQKAIEDLSRFGN